MRGIRTFCVAARHENFRLAAEELFVTASAVSHQIKKLQDELQVELFQRQGRSLQLTAAGRILFEEASESIRRLDDVAGQLRAGYQRASLRVSVQPFFASELFVPKLNEFTSANPRIDIHVDTSDETSERHPADADVSIRLFRSVPEGLHADRLFPLRLVPACSPDFREQLNVVGWHVSRALPIVVHSSRPNAWKTWSDHSGIQVPKSTNMIRLDSMVAVARAAERGLGAALVPLPLAEAWFQAGTLVRLFDYELVTRDCYYFVCNESVMKRDDITALRDWVIKSFAEI
ncbi:MAG: LysR substrate-binding domain-containing protein [Steroidobacteraceae bacterium]